MFLYQVLVQNDSQSPDSLYNVSLFDALLYVVLLESIETHKIIL